MYKVTREDFEKLIRESLRRVPRQFQKYLDGVEIVLQDEPGPEAGCHSGQKLLGLYVGIPLTQMSVFQPFDYPKMIFLYQRNHERLCRTEAELKCQIRATLLHEIGHHFGLSESDLQRIERQWARRAGE